MCTNLYKIRIRGNREMYVKCGKCKACKQEKAIARANRIRADLRDDGTSLPLFVTLTYHNLYIPYFDYDELVSSPWIRPSRANVVSASKDFGCVPYKVISVYRNALCEYVRDPDSAISTYNYSQRLHRGKHLVTKIPVSYNDLMENGHFMKCPKTLQGRGSLVKGHKVAVCYYRDIQNFFKRLRINLTRKYNYDLPLSFYSCSEYGPNTLRSHFHLFINARRRPEKTLAEDFEFWRNAIVEAWPYASRYLTKNNIEIARNAASYVASYVNCDASLSDLFKNCKELRPSHSYSKGFGMAKRSFSISEVLQAIRRRDLRFDVWRNKDGACVVDSVLLPCYVLSRYFPKFKGYSNLTYDEIVDVFFTPSNIRRYSHRCEYSLDDCHRIEVMLRNKMKFALKNGIYLLDYADAFASCWKIRASNVLHDFYDSICLTKDYFYAYDNIEDFYDGVVQSDLESLLPSLPSSFRVIRSPNEFPDNVAKTLKLEKCYDDYSKDRKARNICYSNYVPKFAI